MAYISNEIQNLTMKCLSFLALNLYSPCGKNYSKILMGFQKMLMVLTEITKCQMGQQNITSFHVRTLDLNTKLSADAE